MTPAAPRLALLLILMLAAATGLWAQTQVAKAAAPAPPAPTFKPRIVVIDPGHGGNHRGGTGKVNGRTVTEAELTLPIAFEAEKLFARDPMFQPRLTRRTDVYVGLRERTRLAEQFQGDIFVSIHYNAVANAAQAKSARGMEIWTWSPKVNDNAATSYLRNLENEEGLFSLGDANKSATPVLSQMMIDALEEQALESREFADSLERAFLRDSYFKNHYRGQKQSRFKVLENYDMPSTLIEVGFIGHPSDVKQAVDRKFQQRVAQHIYDGIVHYFETHDPDFAAARRARSRK